MKKTLKMILFIYLVAVVVFFTVAPVFFPFHVEDGIVSINLWGLLWTPITITLGALLIKWLSKNLLNEDGN